MATKIAKVIFKTTDFDYEIRVDKNAKDDFTVTYGLQVKKGLTQTQAAEELGHVLFHAMECEGRLDN